ncbi:MAG: hypothetical protein LQ351_003329 [Letrouitia transgressa]|nr:MAG: hypothetical protein LQ351_003329 [Letrouitia transgressa]
MSASTYIANGDNGDNGSTEGELNAWKHRPPYAIHNSSEHFEARYRGACHCGRVQYQLSREKPLDCKYCHCLTCQKLHGAPFQWCAIFHKTDINFTHGHHDLGWYDPSSQSTAHHLPCKVSCAYCRTPIMDEGRNMILLFPSLIDFESEHDRKNFAARCHMFYGRRVVDINDGKPKWTGLSEQSEPMSEEEGGRGNEGKRKRMEDREREVEEGERDEEKKQKEEDGGKRGE